ncbi:hypothetical protein EVAR_88171_1 [Eumeta japonica]|uniref:Uncharacterized protein n=1 Tax=Eumeta variegata TaxID=151549 RepID=A0A4C1WCT9_EUMVA|nr:hypothetical protein EVAR_88171_1 [Eumeta japonica]
MSILHTSRPYAWVVGLKPTKNPPESFTECAGRHMRVPTARDAIWTTPGGSRLGIGCRRKPSRVGSFPPARRLAAAGWSKGA